MSGAPLDFLLSPTWSQTRARAEDELARAHAACDAARRAVASAARDAADARLLLDMIGLLPHQNDGPSPGLIYPSPSVRR